MNRSVYSSPFRVYLILGVLALTGILCGLKLPISLFPNSSKPVVAVIVPYGNFTPEEFLNSYGREFEYVLKQSVAGTSEVEHLYASYQRREVKYEIEFKWGADPKSAETEVSNRANAYAARLPQEVRDQMQIHQYNENSGFFAASFYSEKMSLDSLHELLEPVLLPKLTEVRDASNAVVYNPTQKEVRIELLPEVMASLKLFPADIDRALATVLKSYAGGSVAVGTRQYFVEMPRLPVSIEDLGKIPIKSGTGKWVHLSDVAKIDVGPKTMDSRSFKTSGASSLIVFANPKPGGNVKKMSEDIVKAIDTVMPSLPNDIQYKVLVDPSEFIRSAVNNVLHEVIIAALLAVIVLFLFIGSFRNVFTAAIEIPLSMILAFILMRVFGINLNLISLGGLALSAGMNVDASVVVMENIFRKFEDHPGRLPFKERLLLVTEAVSEVRFAVIASTIASLVVFLPLVFTSGLSYAILGDLAMAVVFSHGLSAGVALILVPTIRLQLMGKESRHEPPVIERQIQWLEKTYSNRLQSFLENSKAKRIALITVPIAIVLVVVLVLPNLRKEIVATPDTDWIFLNVKTQGNTLLRQTEVHTEEVEGEVLKEFGDKIKYTFTQVNGLNNATIMSRLKKKSDMNAVWDGMEKRFSNTPFTKFHVGPWNPSELPIPDPPHLKLAVRGINPNERADIAKELSELLQEKQLYPRVWTTPNVDSDASIKIEPYFDQWEALTKREASISNAMLADLSRVATVGRITGYLPQKNLLLPVMLRFPHGYIEAPEDLAAMPVGIGDKIVPLKSLANIHVTKSRPSIYREDDQELHTIEAKLHRSNEREVGAFAEKAGALLSTWKAANHEKLDSSRVTVTMEDANRELNEAVNELKSAVGLSILLIFFVLMFQFGSVVESILVLVAIPLGFLGVMISLYVFQSTLSLNSILGVILLNGISVANSILLVDFTKRLHQEGLPPKEAAVQAARLRLRPILITSLTTILGMLPIAIGLGEGGRILQPLGIAVSGGLWVSMILTLFLVPALHAWALERKVWLPDLKSAWSRAKSSRKAVTTSLLLLLSLNATGAEDPITVDFNSALKTIIERNTSLGIAKANLSAEEANNIPSRLIFLPSLSATGYRREARDYGTTSTDLSHGAELSSSINLLKFGADFAGVRKANYSEKALSHAIENAWLSAEDSGVRSIVSLIQSTLEVRIYNEISDAFLRSLEIARDRYRQGLLPNQEVDKVLIDFENSTASLRDAEIRLKSAKARMVLELGHDGVEIEWPWKESLSEKNPDLAYEDKSLSSRPDWLQAEAQLKKAEAEIDQTFGKVFPSVDLGVSYGYLKQNTLNREGDYWSARLSITIPIFDRLSNFSDYRVKVHNKAASEYSFEQIKRNARREWEASKTAFDIALETARTRDNTLLTARSLYRDNLRRFHRGMTSANDLIVDQNRMANAELFALRGWAQVHLNFMEVCHAMGKRLQDCPLSNREPASKTSP